MQHWHRTAAAAAVVPAPFLTLAGPAHAQAAQTEWPMSYLRAAGTQAASILPHLWGLAAISIAVVVIISILVIIGSIWRRSPRQTGPLRYPVLRQVGGTAWITIGVGLSTVVLIGSMAWSAVVLTEIAEPPSEPAFDIHVRAHQWWWEVRYESEDQSRNFETANEVHLPVGQPVRLTLTASDVIHSFWVPPLGGKRDMIPGQTNSMWLEASEAGAYQGWCQEYCGAQHALMRLQVVAQEPEAFEAWWRDQLETAPAPSSQLEREGEEVFLAKCAVCHSVRGSRAGGELGPDLSGLMSRRTLAAGVLRNTPANLRGWIANPQGIKPESKMPNPELSGPQLTAVHRYLQTLR